MQKFPDFVAGFSHYLKPLTRDGPQLTFMLFHPCIDGGIALDSSVESQQIRSHRRSGHIACFRPFSDLGAHSKLLPFMRAKKMQNQEIIGQWGESAPYWAKYRDVIVEMFAPVAQALIEDARIAKGNSVLDLATGPGEPALTIAELVGPEGTVVGTDVAPEMVEAALREASRRKL